MMILFSCSTNNDIHSMYLVSLFVIFHTPTQTTQHTIVRWFIKKHLWKYIYKKMRTWCLDEPSVPASSQQTASASNGKPSVIPVSTQSPLASVTQPVRDDVTMDPSCDSYGVCYDVSLKCTDTKILVNVRTSKPFHGRIYALGRSETCNAHIRNSQQFSLDMSLSGQDCNTQSVVCILAR